MFNNILEGRILTSYTIVIVIGSRICTAFNEHPQSDKRKDKPCVLNIIALIAKHVQCLVLQLPRNFFHSCLQSICQRKGKVLLAGQPGMSRLEQNFPLNRNMTISSSFTSNFKTWLLNNQHCQHRTT